MEFNGKWITLPWKGWEDIEISPEGIRTRRGVISPDKLDLLFWKASYYDRGRRADEDANQAASPGNLALPR